MTTDFSNTRVFNTAEPIAVQESTISATPYHRHSFLEFSYVAEGSAVHYFQNQSIVVKKGDYFAVNYDEVHKFSTNEGDSFKVINILFKPEFIDASLKDCQGFQDLIAITNINCNYFNLEVIPTSIIYHDKSGDVLALFEKMLVEYSQKKVKYRELMRCYLTELIIATLREIHRASNDTKYHDHTVNEILNYINENFASDIKLKDLGEQLGYNPSYLSSLFSNKLGISFSKYLQNVRLTNACDLLANTAKSIEDISIECGYNDTKFFRTIFKNKLKMSPSAFRFKVQKNTIL